jgi:hypothetical protein
MLIFVKAATAETCKPASCPGRLVPRFRDDADAKQRPFGLVQKLHLPLGVLLEFTRNAADHVAANGGQLFPGGIVIGKLGAVIARPGIGAVLNVKEIERHGTAPMHRGCPWARETPTSSVDSELHQAG